MSDFKQLQQDFMGYVRDPKRPIPAGASEERMGIYRELMLNNVSSFVDSGFPVLKSLLTEDRWQQLKRDFFKEHDCTSPLFVEIAKEFLCYLQQGFQPQAGEPPYVVELAHYEYLELKLDIEPEDLSRQTLGANDDLAMTPLYLNRVAELAQYHYPLHQVSANNVEVEQQQTLLLVYRDSELDIRFMAVNGMTATLLSLLDTEQPTELDKIISSLQQQFTQFPEQVIAQGALQTLATLARAGVVVKDGVGQKT